MGGPVTGRTRVAAVIGSPVRHSLSPTILNAAFAATGLDWVYVAFEVPEGRGGDAVAAVRTLGLAGLSVTMPHKAAVHDAVDERTPVAAALGAVNCVFWRGTGWSATTRTPLASSALRDDEGVEVAGATASSSVPEAGRAVAHAGGRRRRRGRRRVNRSPSPASGPPRLRARRRVGEPDDVARADLVVNATPLGMGVTAPTSRCRSTSSCCARARWSST